MTEYLDQVRVDREVIRLTNHSREVATIIPTDLADSILDSIEALGSRERLIQELRRITAESGSRR